MTKAAKEMNPRDVLIDLLGGADFDHEILNPEEAADLIIERLRDSRLEQCDRQPKKLNRVA
jgi:hypothetical protein